MDINLNQIIDNEEYWKEVGLELSKSIHADVEKERFMRYHTPVETNLKKAIKEDLMHRKKIQE